MNWGELVQPIERDPPGSPPQRGFIEPRHAWHLKSILQVANVMGSKILGIENPLEADIDKTPERVQKVESTLKVMAKGGQTQLGDLEPQQFVDLVMAELFGYGPIDRFLNQTDISEVMVNGPFIIFIERKGKLVETGHKFLDDAHVERMIRRIVRPLGRRDRPREPAGRRPAPGRLPRERGRQPVCARRAEHDDPKVRDPQDGVVRPRRLAARCRRRWRGSWRQSSRPGRTSWCPAAPAPERRRSSTRCPSSSPTGSGS